MKPTRRTPTPSLLRARPFAAAGLCVAAMLVSAAAAPAHAQEASDTGQGAVPGGMTILGSPPDALIAVRGSSELLGTSPLELGPDWVGRYVITVEAPGYASAEGAFFFPPRGSQPYALSDRVLLRSLYFPGVTALQSRRKGRGLALLAAGVGGLGAVVRDHLEYQSNRDKADFESQDRAEGFRYAQGRWALYTGAVWGMSAVDHILRARVALLEATPTQVTFGAPKLSRASVVWRSLLIPGAGQDYATQRTRGSLWLGGTLLSGAAYLTADESHHRIGTKLARAKVLLADAGPTEILDRQADVDHFTDLEERSKRLEERLALTTALIYVANVLDAGLVPIGGGSSARKKVSISAPVGFRRAEIALNLTF